MLNRKLCAGDLVKVTKNWYWYKYGSIENYAFSHSTNKRLKASWATSSNTSNVINHYNQSITTFAGSQTFNPQTTVVTATSWPLSSITTTVARNSVYYTPGITFYPTMKITTSSNLEFDFYSEPMPYNIPLLVIGEHDNTIVFFYDNCVYDVTAGEYAHITSDFELLSDGEC